MKKIFTTLLLLGGFLVLLSCEDPQGPQGVPGIDGQDGLDGIDGVNSLSEVFEAQISFNEENNFSAVFEFDPQIFEGDVLLVFLNWESIENQRFWRALPQTVFFEEGILTYNYDFSRSFLRIYLETSFEPVELGEDWTTNQTFRIVVVPGEFANARIDFTDYDAVMKLIGAKEASIKTLIPKK